MPTLAERADIALKMVREAPTIAYDVETSGLDWKRNHPVGYVISVAKDSIYVPIRHGGGGNLMSGGTPPLANPEGPFVLHPFETELSKAFLERRSYGHRTVGHNILFDAHFSANAGIYLGRNLEDTQNNEAMLDEYARGYSLDSCAKAHKVTAKLGDDLYRELAERFGCDPSRKSMEHFWRLSGANILGRDYAEGDGVTTYELWQSQQKLIADDEIQFIHDIESRLIWTVFKMERIGIRVDPDRLKWLKEEMYHRVKKAELELPEGFNVRSGPQVKALLENAGHTDWPTTALGNPSFPEKWLKTKAEGRAIVTVRKLSNLSNSFVTPLEERHIWNGRVHCQFNQLKSDEFGTISGRFSSSGPNMQQIPKRDKDLGALFRSLFIPDDGMEFVEADYSQCEPRLFAHYSNEPALIDGYNSDPPLDMHSVVAEALVVERDPTAKRMNMGILTGMQKRTFAGHMGWDLDRASEAFDSWMRAFPGIKDFQDVAKQRMLARGWVKSVLGRRLRMDERRFAYRAVSKIIQGSNADIIKYKMLLCDEFIESNNLEENIQILATVHDSLAWQNTMDKIGRDAAAAMVRICCDVQTPPFDLKVPFIMDVGRGANWSEATYGDKNREFDEEIE